MKNIYVSYILKSSLRHHRKYVTNKQFEKLLQLEVISFFAKDIMTDKVLINK